MPNYTSNLGATAGSGQDVDYNGNSYTQDGTADPDYFSVNRSANASDGGSASLIGNSVTLNGTGGNDQFYVYLEAIAQSGGQAVSSDNIVTINGGDGNDGRYDNYYYQSYSYDRAIADGTGSSATSSSNQLVYSGGPGDDFHYHYSYGQAYYGGTVAISGSVAQLSGGDGADHLIAQRWVNAYGVGSVASLTDTEFALSGGTGGDQLQGYVGGHADGGGVVTVTGNNTSLFGDAGYDNLYGGIYAGAYGAASSTLTSGNTLAFDSGADGGYVNFWVQAYTDMGSATVADNIVTITGGDGTDYVSGYLYAYTYDYYNNNSGNSAVTNNNVTADLGAGADTFDFYFYANSYDYYSNSDDEDVLSVTGNVLTALGGTGSDTLRVHFYRYDYDGSSEISISGNSAMLDGGADADYLHAYLQEGTEGNDVTLVGGSGNDTFLSWDQGNNTRLFIGGAGNDTITDQEGQSTAQFSGAKSSYSIVINGDGSVTVTDLRSGSPDGTDTLRGVDVLRFSNGDFLPDGTRISGNTAPVSTPDGYDIDEDGTLTIPATGVLANDIDDDGDTLTAILVDGPTNGTLTLNANGSFVYTPNANYNGPDSFTYRANDGEEDGNLVTVSITVNSVNDAPSAPTDADITGNVGVASATLAEDHAVGATIGITAAATDVDAGDVVTFDLGLDGGGNPIFDDGTFAIDPATGVVTLSGALNYEDDTSHTLRIFATDGTARSHTDFVINVTNVAPSAPVDSNGAANTIAENAADGTPTGVTAFSTDVNGGDVSYVMTDDSGGRFRIDPATGAIVATGTGNLDYETAPFSDAGGRYYEVTVGASDGIAGSAPIAFKIYVTNVVEHLFTANNDGTAAAPINFNTLPDGAYDFDGAQYDALAGNDFVYLPNLATVDAGNPWDYTRTFNAGAGNDVVQGGNGNDVISGGDGNDTLFGGLGDDRLVGSSGDDILGGGDGSDKLTGSSGRDIFIFTDSEFGTSKLGEHDVITDFQQGTDKIDISALYDNGVVFGGLKAGALTGAGNAYKVGYYSASGKTWLEGDVNGDGVADWFIELSGSYKLKGTDLVVGTSVVASEAQWSSASGGLPYAQHHQDDYFLL